MSRPNGKLGKAFDRGVSAGQIFKKTGEPQASHYEGYAPQRYSAWKQGFDYIVNKKKADDKMPPM